MPSRSALPKSSRRLIRIAAVTVLLGGVLVPASAAGASTTGCDLLSSLLRMRLCSSPSLAPSSSGSASGAAPACGGEPVLKVTGVPWRCTFDDEFSGTALNRSRWTVQKTATYGFHSGAECIVDNPKNVSVANGHLNLTVRDVGTPITCSSPLGAFVTRYTGASVYTATFSQQYGRFEIRAKFSQGNGIRGIQSALWMYARQMSATAAVSGSNEIDIAEAYSFRPNIVVPTVHGLTVSYLLPTSYCTVPDWGAAFHTYAVEWTSSNVTFIYDGTPCMKVATPPALLASGSPNPFLVALSQTLGIGGNSNTSATPLPATEKIDYVRAWK